jgi:Reverse transcriptase (RNA-dependent DNA polymerase)
LLVTSYSVPSLYDHIHLVTGHPSPSVMAWHQKNSTNAAYTAKDAAQSRPVCQSCVYGSMHQTRTDRYREHRPHTTIPGQQWSVDAYSHNRSSYRRKLYCDLFTDNGNGRIYCVFTKDRSSKELISQTSILFALHPAWQQRHENVDRFFRLDPENNYRSEAFKLAASAFGYRIEPTAPRDKHANGIAERTVGVIAVKTNIAMLNPDPSVPGKFWCLAMEYACDTHSFNYHSRYGDSPYHLITGRHVDVRQLYPFWCRCWVYIPLSDRHGKINAPRALKAHFVGYSYTTILTKTYKYVEVYADGTYGKVRISKDVIFDQSINFTSMRQPTPTEDAFGYGQTLSYPLNATNAEHRVRFSNSHMLSRTDRGEPAAPTVLPTSILKPPAAPAEPRTDPPSSDPHLEQPKKPPRIISEIQRINRDETTQHDRFKPAHRDTTRSRKDPNALQAFDEDNIAQYWFNYLSPNYEYSLSSVETQHFTLTVTAKDDTVPKSFWQAMKDPEWAAAIDKERDKFEVNKCLAEVPFVNQHLVPMMWLFSIKTDGTKKARLVGRGDMMIPWVDFDPNAVYCGNVAASSIKMALVIAAMYKLVMRGGDLVGAYLVTLANPDFPVHIKTPQGYNIAPGMCIQAIGNLYGFPPAGQNFSKEFDKCLKEAGYKNTPWDPKFFFKWMKGKPIIVIAHSDDFRWFGPPELISEWNILVSTFNRHKYEVTDATNKEFVGIHIYHDEHFNYFMDQERMINAIIAEAKIGGDKDEKLPYPLTGNALSKMDCLAHPSTNTNALNTHIAKWSVNSCTEWSTQW